MKKVILSIALALLTGNVMAQTPEDKAAAKAAAKAAKAALKKATKYANTLLTQGMACADEVNSLHQANQMELQKADEANHALIAENNEKILKKSLEGIAYLSEAISEENIQYIKENKRFEAYRGLDQVATKVFSSEIDKAQKKEPYDHAALTTAIYSLSESCHGMLTYGNPKDEIQSPYINVAKEKFPKTHSYYAILSHFCVLANDLEGADKALQAYINFPVKYPEVADNEIVKNPQYSPSQFAFNIFLTAYNQKNMELMNKYYDLALEFNPDYVLRAKPMILKEQGKTEEWIVATHEMIAINPMSEIAEWGMGELMKYYSAQGNESTDAYTAELVSKYPQSKMANYCRGFAYNVKNDLENAIKFFEKSLEIEPNYVDPIYSCGYCYYQLANEKGRAVGGKKYKTKAAAIAAADEVKALYSKAAPYFEKYRELTEGKDPSKWAEPLFYIYKNIGQKDKAAEMEAYID